MRRSDLLIAFVMFFLSIVSTPLAAAGQGGTVRGRVVDSTGVPVAAAVIVLDPGGRRAVSRDNGESVGGRNLFDVYPDRMSENNGFDIFPWPPASPFGYNGRYVYTRVELTGR